MSCPDPETLDRYAAGKLPGEQAAAVAGHLESCPACRDLAEQAAADDRLLTRLRQILQSDGGPGPAQPQRPGLTIEKAQELLGGRYRVVREVGQGSGSCVFQAVDGIISRQVAVKFLKAGPTAGSEWQEARMMGQLSHPYVAQIHEIGQAGPYKFMVMEWVDGLPLAKAWAGLGLAQRLAVYAKVLDAVSAAHQRGIIHRDLKPTNVLVGPGLGPKVLDFGIALETECQPDLDPGLYRGTPAYSAPEQITVPVQVTPATDVYALGVMLYQLLTDSLPFPQTDAADLFDAIRSRYPELPTAVQADVPLALQNICLKCLEKDPGRRYPDARHLAEDVGRYLRGERVWARPSFVTDQVQQDLFHHRQKLKVWRDNGLLTEQELDRLETIYKRMVDPADPSIIESRHLSFSQVCLYLGGWITVLGSVVLFYKTWDTIPLAWRPAPAWIASAVMMTLGTILWRQKETRLAVGFLATVNLLIPVTLALTLGQWGILSAETAAWGDESIHKALSEAGSYVLIGNLQIQISTWCWLAASAALVWMTRSSIFAMFSVVAGLAVLTSTYLIHGMAQWAPDVIAGRYLWPAIGLFLLGTVLDVKGARRYAWPPLIAGLVLLVGSMTILALSENTLLGWVYAKPAGLAQTECRALSFMVDGIVFLSLAGVCRWLDTPLQRAVAKALNWMGPLHLLAPLRILDLDSMELATSHRILYRFALPIASFCFVFASVTRQMKSFFFSGLSGIAASVHKLTVEHLDKFFAWPVTLIATGLVSMFASWILPRWRANRTLRKKVDR
jgi:serine/threonine protein kinase/uncharacterized membrane protein YgdD (TMEM256/DUF423 family)